MTLKYYEYISDSKVDMLLPQVPLQVKQKVSFESGLDLKVFSSKVKTEISTLDTRVARVQAVSCYILDTESVGTIEKPERWVYGCHTVQAGLMGNDNEIVIYGGSVFGTTFMLAGSSFNVTGHGSAKAELRQSYSYLPSLLRAFKDTNATLEEHITAQHEGVEKALAIEMGGGVDDSGNAWLRAAQQAWLRFDGPVIEIEFLARKLLLDGEEESKILIATPIYVARLD